MYGDPLPMDVMGHHMEEPFIHDVSITASPHHQPMYDLVKTEDSPVIADRLMQTPLGGHACLERLGRLSLTRVVGLRPFVLLFNSPVVSTFPVPRDSASQLPPRDGDIHLPNVPLSGLTSLRSSPKQHPASA
ncbi:hypothetical protein PHLGIDRAFT_119579 [Phlebiopsis gigantea 11061_1 CR5-6]|uniref:Uncharacterized protein n=1 Tax=Phlebiopsis gigantea (strain 11061_1 CR5-6) TaxID=745531 RepID=A0A0C3S5R0_PHLG1|nr:hypothetical protein PHLGIDRAFT_119579 [Phlebiopsis gigantea 11061_1 CR5-6]